MFLRKLSFTSIIAQRSPVGVMNSVHLALTNCQTPLTSGNVGTCQTNIHNLTHRKDAPLYNACNVRFYNKRKTIRIPPTKPLSFDIAGDHTFNLPPIDPSAPKAGYEEVDILKSADSRVKTMYSMEFADGAEIREKRMQELMAAVQEHPADTDSLEVQIARNTLVLRNMVRHCLQYRKDRRTKARLVRKIYKRNDNLRLLRMYDMEKFEWLLNVLRIKYIPKKTVHEERHVSKRAARKRAARMVYFDAKQDKLEALRERLAAERVSFEKEKDEEMTRISAELEIMGITEMKSVETVLTAIDMEKYIEKPEILMKRRCAVLQRKFALHEEREKAKKAAKAAELL